MAVEIIPGDCRNVLPTLDAGSVHCCVTSPPYFGLRDYGVADQIGLEPTPDEFIEQMVAVFREVRRVLRDDGTLWLNIGDSYAASGRGGNPEDSQHQKQASNRGSRSFFHNQMVANGLIGRKWVKPPTGYKPKDLIGIPWMLAFALCADGWYLRQDIIWSKPNPMPESVRDRCTKAHEYLFLLSKGPRYYYDAAAVAEGLAEASISRLAQNVEGQRGSDRVPGKTNGAMKAVGGRRRGVPPRHAQYPDSSDQRGLDDVGRGGQRNKRSVWTIPTQPFSEAHFATFPPALVEPCILAGCPSGGTVLDPFGGAGTTGLVADRLQRNAVLIELNPEYADIARRRIDGDRGGLLNAMEAA